MNFCSKCGNKFEKENVFCSKCGFKLDVKNESILGLKTAKETSAKPSKIKGNSVDEIQQQKEDNKTFKTHNILNYVITRKRNILIFILLTLVLKPILHYTFFEKQEEFINYDRKITIGRYNKDTYTKDSLGNFDRATRDDASFINVFRLNYDTSFYTQKGELIQSERLGSGTDGTYLNYYFYLKDFKKVSFKKTLDAIFTDKVWIFLISFAVIGLIAFLFNDKIKAR